MQKILFLFISVMILTALQTKANNLKIIQSVTVETDYTLEGTKGINITYRYNFLSLEEEHHNDTILKNSIFKIKTSVSENDEVIEPANGYKSVTDENGDLEFTITLMGSEIEASKFDKNVSQFIPYASLKLNEGVHTISVNAEITGKDATGFLHQQKIAKTNIEFKKPATKNFTLNIDFIEVSTLNTNGKAWDYSLFKTDAPDVGVNILVGNTSVYKNHVNDTYMFAVGPNSKNIQFTISENDKVAILVQDIDVMFDDFIAKLLFKTGDKKSGTLYSYNTAKGNIKSCNITFKIE